MEYKTTKSDILGLSSFFISLILLAYVAKYANGENGNAFLCLILAPIFGTAGTIALIFSKKYRKNFALFLLFGFVILMLLK